MLKHKQTHGMLTQSSPDKPQYGSTETPAKSSEVQLAVEKGYAPVPSSQRKGVSSDAPDNSESMIEQFTNLTEKVT